MIQILQMKLKANHLEDEPYKKALKILKISSEHVKKVTIFKRSVDARKKPDIYYVYTMHIETNYSSKKEQQLVKGLRNKNITITNVSVYKFPKSGEIPLKHRPVIIGMGPAGMFCGLLLSRAGYRPVIIERGEPVEDRVKTVNKFWEDGILNPESNVQFGEGGAGTFSDGKLNTLVKDEKGRSRKVLEIFTKAGAPEDILYVNKPHIGTDVLRNVVMNIRKEIISNGGEIIFNTKVTKIEHKNKCVTGVYTEGKYTGFIASDQVVLAIGHSSRDTFTMLKESGFFMEPKSFAVGMRIEHKQTLINKSQYGMENCEYLMAADYKLTHKSSNGRGVYSFCMCPGGQVVNSSSEKGRLTVNGMSNRARDGVNANSALIVTVTPEDFGTEDVLSGMEFQRKLEERAYAAGNGMIPSQKYVDFKNNIKTESFGKVKPDHKGLTNMANLRGILPDEVEKSLIEGIEAFGRKIKGFSDDDAVLSGVEARTSSPVKIVRDEKLMSNIKGVYPCGEGPGYAGGIMSAAMDGCKAAEVIASNYSPSLSFNNILEEKLKID